MSDPKPTPTGCKSSNDATHGIRSGRWRSSLPGRLARPYGSEGWGFESLRARQSKRRLTCGNAGQAIL